MSKNQTTRYFKYAIGEIVLVVIGILIALWINNLNQEQQLKKERQVLITLLAQELNENLIQFKLRGASLAETNSKLIKVLNFSAGAKSQVSLDSLKAYVIQSLTFPFAYINNSRLSSAKESGKYELLPEALTTSLTQYETSINNYRNFRDGTTLFFGEGWSEVNLTFNALTNIHQEFYNEKLKKHPQFELNEEVLKAYLKEPETYKTLHKYYAKNMVENAWLLELQGRIKATLEIIKKTDND